ncbi:MAG TPA: ABC transporter ATP-binding protein, partial [Phycisphaerales bacterium]|nr:ABC transporter ATP-binding protein [Phycisphaerales bacterium]
MSSHDPESHLDQPLQRGSSSRRFLLYRTFVSSRRRQAREGQIYMTYRGTTRSMKRSRSAGELFRIFLSMLGRRRWTITVALGLLTVGTVLGLLPPAATKLVIDYAFTDTALPPSLGRWLPDAWNPDGDPRRLLLIIACVLVVVAFASVLCSLCSRWQATKASRIIAVSVRKRVFEHAVRLPLDRVGELRSGGVASLLREDAGGIADLVFGLLYNPWRAVIQLVGIFIILAFTDWRLLLGAFCILPMVWYTHRIWINRIRPLYRDIRVQRSNIDAHATEVFSGMRVVRAFGRSRTESGRFTSGNHMLARQEIHAWWWSRITETIWALAIPLASAGLLFYGGLQVLDGVITVGDLVMFLTYLLLLLGPIETLASSATSFQTNLAGLDRVMDLLEEQRELPDPADAVSLDRAAIAGRLEVDGVSFSYPSSSQPVLSGVSFHA